MALVKNILIEGLRVICDSEYSGFKDYPESIQDAAIKWGDALDSYARAVVPVSTTSALAKEAFKTEFLKIPSIEDISGISQAIKSYADVLGTGMNPAFSAIVLPQGPNFSSVAELGLAGGTALDCITLLSSLTDTWLKSCTATNNVSGVTVPWS